MKIRLLLRFTILLLSLNLNTFAQSYLMSDTVITTCSGTFYDDGGPNGNYSLNKSTTMTFTSANGATLKFDFSLLTTVYGLTAYDGATTTAPLIGTYGTGLAPFTVQSTGTSITFQFISGNIAVQAIGWAATISCATPVIPSYPMVNGQNVITCEGIFYDDGGADSVYSNNQNTVMTFCPTTANDYLVFNFTNQFDLGFGDTLFVYSGTSTSTSPIGVYVGSNLLTRISSPIAGACLTFKFVTDGSSVSSGWQGFINCSTTPVYTLSMLSGTIPTCGGLFYDSGGPTGNYDTNSENRVTFTSTNGATLRFDFSSLVSVYGLNAYDGTTTAAPLLGSYGAGLAPFSIQSTGTSITFEFITGNISTQSAGWAASISCSTPVLTSYPLTNGQTITACSGVFYDDGGADSLYSNAQNSVMTFCPDSVGDFLVFNFDHQFELSLGDTLFVYSGSNTASSPIGVYVGSNARSSISSPQAGACVTFKFVSDGSFNSNGWQGIMSCSSIPVYTMSMISGTIPTCGGFFYDSGGPAGNYETNSSSTVTFTSISGCELRFDFGSLVTTYGLNAYDGTSNSAPLLGSYGSGIAPFTVQSTGPSITFEFTTGNISTQSNGWGAVISCPTTTTAQISPGGITTLCAGDSVLLTANAASSYLWNTGDTSQAIYVHSSGNYFVDITNNLGCSATSAISTVVINPLPAAPLIQESGTNLISSPASSYQWYLNSNLLNGADSAVYPVTQNGIYTVQITDSNGCSIFSQPYNYTSVGLNKLQVSKSISIHPNPNSGRFKISLAKNQSGYLSLINLLGEVQFECEIPDKEIEIPQHLKGIFLLKLQVNGEYYYEKVVVR